jgi:hypothetical protein
MARPKTTVKERLQEKTFDYDKIIKLAEHGLTDAEIANILDINETTLNRWKSDPEFLQALKKGKEVADSKVERALYEKAVGYSHEDLYITQFQGDIIKEKIIKHYPPSEVACIFWLKNRQRDRWKDKWPDDEFNIDVNEIDGRVDDKTDEQIKEEWLRRNGKSAKH